jgi:hypothetical protein
MPRWQYMPHHFLIVLILSVTIVSCAVAPVRSSSGSGAPPADSTSTSVGSETPSAETGQPSSDSPGAAQTSERPTADLNDQSPTPGARSHLPGLPPLAQGAPFEPPKPGQALESPLTVPQWGLLGLPFSAAKEQIEQEIKETACPDHTLCLHYAADADEDTCVLKEDPHNKGAVETRPADGKPIKRGGTIVFVCKKPSPEPTTGPTTGPTKTNPIKTSESTPRAPH